MSTNPGPKKNAVGNIHTIYKKTFFIKQKKGGVSTNPEPSSMQRLSIRKTQRRQIKGVYHHCFSDAIVGRTNPRGLHVWIPSLRPAIDFPWRGRWISPGCRLIGLDTRGAEVWELLEGAWPGKGSKAPESVTWGVLHSGSHRQRTAWNPLLLPYDYLPGSTVAGVVLSAC